MSIRAIAKKLPPSMWHKLNYVYSYVPPRFRYGKLFWGTYNLLNESQWWSKNKLTEYQMGELSKLLEHAYENVPYYRRVFDERNLKPSDIESVASLGKLPYLTKQIIQSNFGDLRARNIPRGKVEMVSTSGSTGSPFSFLREKDLEEVQKAFIARAFNSHDSRLYFEKTTWLRSYVPKEKEPIYRYEPHERMMFLSAYNLSSKTIRDYKRLIETYEGRTLVGYPSSLYILALLAEREGLQINGLDVTHVGSEALLDEWERKIEQVLGVPVKDHYGMAERVALFHRCGNSNLYHENLEYAVVEIVNQEGDMGEVVGTSLWNYAMPLIRYKTGDYARVHRGNATCECGRGLPLSVSKFEGRTDDIIVTAGNHYIPGVNFYTLLYKIPGIKMFKIIQHALAEVEVQVMASDAFTADREFVLFDGLRQRLGPEVRVEINRVEEIKRDERTGKIRCIESKVYQSHGIGASS